jgi:hypothetical protein
MFIKQSFTLHLNKSVDEYKKEHNCQKNYSAEKNYLVHDKTN